MVGYTSLGFQILSKVSNITTRYLTPLFMFSFRKKASDNNQPNRDSTPSGLSFRQRLKAGLSRTRQALFGDITELFKSSGSIDAVLDELEMRLLMADAGIEATQEIIDELRSSCKNEEQLLAGLQRILLEKLTPHEHPLALDTLPAPAVILIIGVNGVGKTTTIGKLSKRFQAQGKKVMLAAGDTFRAAAVEQLQAWGERHDVPVVAQATGADSASVIYDAFEAAKARDMDILIADTAGRLHNKSNLMEELAKIKRVLGKIDTQAPHETLLVLDAATGQNAVSQTKEFNEAVGITGLALTKLDGTAKGGVLFALARQFDIPVRYIGVGEQADDLRDFKAADFIDALLDNKQDE